MVVVKEFLIYCRQGVKNRLDVEVEGASVVESVGDGTEAMEAMEAVEAVEAVAEGRNNGDEDWTSREVATSASVESPYVEKAQARAMEAVVDVEELRQLVDEWKHLCVLCKIHGRFSSDHRHSLPQSNGGYVDSIDCPPRDRSERLRTFQHGVHSIEVHPVELRYARFWRNRPKFGQITRRIYASKFCMRSHSASRVVGAISLS